MALVTYAAKPALTEDDALCAGSLRARGVGVEAVPWDRPDVAWERYAAVVIRSTWDYHQRPDAFRAWLDALQARRALVWNPVPMLRWNMDKRYLLPLGAQLPVIPTELVEAAGATTLAEVLAHRGWREVVVKPAISASGEDTWRTGAERAGADEPRFQALLRRGPVLLQPFIAAIENEGEWSLVYFQGRFSHGILKTPAAGEFRVQKQHGGHSRSQRPPDAVLADAGAILAAVEEPWLYARVDGCVVEGAFLLMELELLEPALELWADPGAPVRFAEAIIACLGHAPGRGR